MSNSERLDRYFNSNTKRGGLGARIRALNKKSGHPTPFDGVLWSDGTWLAVGGRWRQRVDLGVFDSPAEASRAYASWRASIRWPLRRRSTVLKPGAESGALQPVYW